MIFIAESGSALLQGHADLPLPGADNTVRVLANSTRVRPWPGGRAGGGLNGSAVIDGMAADDDF